MTEFFRTAIYTKNVPAAERSLRFAAAVLVGVLGSYYLAEPWMRWSAIATGAMFAMTGLLGFCPACYMAGRRLSSRSAG